MSHTPTPYHINEDGDICAMFSGIEYIIALPVPHPSIGRYNREETAAFIVKACNLHDALVAALTDVVDWCGERKDLGDLARAALKVAGVA